MFVGLPPGIKKNLVWATKFKFSPKYNSLYFASIMVLSTSYKSVMYKGFKRLQEKTDAIYLNEEELNKIYKLDLRKNKRLERVRDLFIVECNTGVRYNDLMNITKENILKENIYLKRVSLAQA